MREKFRWGNVIWEGLLLPYKREFKGDKETEGEKSKN
jgi:hypothetical protein